MQRGSRSGGRGTAARAALLLGLGVGACAQIIGAEDPTVQGDGTSSAAGSSGAAQTGGGEAGGGTSAGGQAAGGNGAGGTMAGPGGGGSTGSVMPTCNMNGTKDDPETDVDCGGPACPPCGIREGCDTHADCQTTLCCIPGVLGDQCCNKLAISCDRAGPSCFDDCWNGNETDVDCGGPQCLQTCGPGQRCMMNEDCMPGCTCQTNMMAKECQCP
jgi:hypothetical protein